MTAKDLHDHVIQWPEGARPKGLRLHTAGWFVEDRETGRRAEGETLRVDFQFCNPTTSIALHVASGLEWLRKNVPGGSLLVNNDDKDGNTFIGTYHAQSDWETQNYTAHEGPTLFHAIRAAILATKENA